MSRFLLVVLFLAGAECMPGCLAMRFIPVGSGVAARRAGLHAVVAAKRRLA